MIQDALNLKLNKFKQSALTRKRLIISKRLQNKIVINGINCINFSSNDYLGLSQHEEIKEAFIHGARKYGIGSTSSTLVSGYFEEQAKLEECFATFLNRDRAILFSTGYLANLGAITALVGRHNSIISDKFCHASLLDGIYLSSAMHYRYQHNNIENLKDILTAKKTDLIITESIFSMEGDIAPIKAISQIAQSANASILLDDSHGIGILGKTGAGICEELNLNQNAIACLITPLGKAFGCSGAIISGNNKLIEGILQFARSYRYTTALPPAIIFAISKALVIIKSENWRRDRLKKLIIFFNTQAKERNLAQVSYDITPIRCIYISDNRAAQTVQEKMLAQGFLIACIRPPTVPKGTARIRISLNCLHTEEQIILLLDSLKACLCQIQ